MFKFLKEVVSGSGSGLKDLPYTIGEPYSTAWGSWTHHRGTSKDDGSPVSIFSLSGSNAQDRHLAAGRNGVKRLRTVRHPNILSFLHSTEAEVFDGSTAKHTIYIVTEPVMPLSEKLKELKLEGTQRDEYYAWGLHQISKAVSFLNNDCKLVHGNVCLASVVVTQTLDWKLHAFDVLSEFDSSNEASNNPMLQGLPIALQILGISHCKNLQHLPDYLSELSSLKTLSILSCPQIPYLPVSGLPASLRELYIKDCPMLTARCQQNAGADWPKISHIPNIQVREEGFLPEMTAKRRR
uniref:Protein kinase domain-containing protein n=1 Tax=Ananas comosus var. bracteatus TaxID=296719 RepID=A0A6V7PFB3_ANACO|nr:unnamed protein product [Ananas comosus var. bracteatus]